MLFLILSIICSVSVGAIFKLTRTYNCNPFQIIAFNYIIAIALCYFIFNPNVGQVTAKAPWNIYLAVGILLPVVFYFLVLSIQHIGIVKTDGDEFDSEESLTEYNVFLDQKDTLTGEPYRLFIMVSSSRVNEITSLLTHYIHREYWHRITILSSRFASE